MILFLVLRQKNNLKIAVSVTCFRNENSQKCSKYCKTIENCLCSNDNIKVCRNESKDSSKKNLCNPNPCLNKGICISDNISTKIFRCICQDSYTGPRCEKIEKSCLLFPCINNETCITQANNKSMCKCKLERYGNDCKKKDGQIHKDIRKILIIGISIIICIIIIIAATVSYVIIKRNQGNGVIILRGAAEGDFRPGKHIFGILSFRKTKIIEKLSVKSNNSYDLDEEV